MQTVARILGKEPAQIRLRPAELSAALGGKAPREFGLESKRWRNVKSDFRCVLRDLGVLRPIVYQASKLSGVWRTLLKEVSSQWEGIRLGKFAMFCALSGIEPSDVSDATVAQFVAHVAATELVTKSSTGTSNIVSAWNKVATTCTSVPLQRLAQVRQDGRYVMDVSAFPASFGEDLDKWCARAERSDLADLFDGLDDLADELPSPISPRKASTVELRRTQLLSAASALVYCGRDPQTITSLATLVQTSAMKTAIDWLYQRRQSDSKTGVHGVAEELRQVAKYYVRSDHRTVAWISGLARRLKPQQDGIAPRNRDRLLALDEPRKRAALLHLPHHLLQLAAADTRIMSRFRKASCAVALEILLVCPLRIGNLVALEPERHFRRATTGARLVTHIVIQAEQVKNGQTIEWPIPPETAKVIEVWLRNFRWLLGGGESRWLFPGTGGKHRHIASFRQLFTGEVLKHTGIRLHPHLLRHFAAQLFLEANPGHFEDVRRILGHKSLETTIKAYLPTQTTSSAKRFDGVVLRAREASRQLAKSVLRTPGKRRGHK